MIALSVCFIMTLIVMEQALGAFLFLVCCFGGWEKCFE